MKLFQLDLSPDRVDQLVAEFERLIAAELTHPALSAPLATGRAGECAYLAQDFVAAESFDLAVHEYGPTPPADALRVAAQLAGALDFAAVVNVGHGALHPRDILLSSDETRLTGIGVARALETVGVAAPVRRPYTAPERIAGAAWDRRADVFSLAALTHELLCGRRIAGTGLAALDGLKEVAGAHLSRLQSAFARALAENADDRFEAALEFAEALKEAFPRTAVSLPSSGAREKSKSRAEAAGALPLDEPEIGPALDLHAEPPPSVPIDQEPISVIEQSRSAVWPLIAALAIGLALGFSGGYAVASRERPASPSSLSGSPGDTTEVAIGESVKTAPGAATPQKAPVVATLQEAQAPPVAARPPGPERADAARRAPEREADQGSGQTRAESPVAAGLLVRSTPAGARVVVDGRDAGQTPVALTDLLPGAHRVRIQHDGYVTEDRRVTLTSARPRQSMTVALAALEGKPAPNTAGAATTGRFSGGLAVESRPSGASIYLDGRLVGTTPLTLDAVRAGEHAIRLERDGYRRWSSSIRIVAAESNRVTASLEK